MGTIKRITAASLAALMLLLLFTGCAVTSAPIPSPEITAEPGELASGEPAVSFEPVVSAAPISEVPSGTPIPTEAAPALTEAPSAAFTPEAGNITPPSLTTPTAAVQTPSAAPVQTAKPTAAPTPVPKPTASPTAAPKPTAAPTPTPKPTPVPEPTATPFVLPPVEWYVQYAIDYALSRGLYLSEGVSGSWDTPNVYDPKNPEKCHEFLTKGIRSYIDRYINNEGAAAVWIWCDSHDFDGSTLPYGRYYIYIGRG